MRELEHTVRRRIEAGLAVHQALLADAAAIAAVARALIAAYQEGRKVLLFGNGGSAADAQHIAAELVGRYSLNRQPLPAVALTVNTSSLTAIANDYGFDQVFARQVEAFGQTGDIAIGISTSGRSANVIEGLRAAQRHGLVPILMTGADGGPFAREVDHCLQVPSGETPRIQEGHILIGHILCELVEQGLFGPLEVRTIFLDRDGIINRKMAEGAYVTRWEEFEFLPGVRETLGQLAAAGFRLIVVTNQRAVARGLLSEADLAEIHRRMLTELVQAGAQIDGVYECVHDDGQCSCRKPQPGLFLRAQADFPDIAFHHAVVIGDSLVDIEAGARLGCWTILVGEPLRRAAIVQEASRRGIFIDRTAASLHEAAIRFLLPEPSASGSAFLP